MAIKKILIKSNPLSLFTSYHIKIPQQNKYVILFFLKLPIPTYVRMILHHISNIRKWEFNQKWTYQEHDKDNI